MRKFMRIFLLAVFILAFSSAPLLAGPSWGDGVGGGRGHKATPEIDPNLAPSALAIIAGGLLILKSKSGKKDK